MWATLIASATSSVAGLVALLLVVAGLIGSGAFVEHRIDLAVINGMKAKYATAEAAAVTAAAARQKKEDDNALSASNAEVSAQHRLAASTQAQLAYLKAHPVATPCIPFSVLRLLDAGALGVAPGNLALPAGKSDNSCSTVTAGDLAKTVVDNYGRARSNAEQLDALNALLRQQKIAEKQ